MSRAVFVLAAALAAVHGLAQDPAEGRVSVEIVAVRKTPFVQEPVAIALKVSIDAAWFRENAIQTSRVLLDVPIDVQAPWLKELAGAIVIAAEPPPPGARRATFALNGDKADAPLEDERTPDGRIRHVLRIARRVVPQAPGAVVVPAPTVRFAYATRFEEDLVNGRVPVDRKDAVVRGHELTLSVAPLPEAQRPADFGGAVGHFSIAASTDRKEIGPGETLKLSVTIQGEGNLESFEAPRLASIPVLHVYGVIDTKTGNRRTLVYDVALQGERVAAIPPIPFAFFDPAPPAGYRTVWTAPIPLEVKAGPASAPLKPPAPPPALVPGVSDVFGLVPSGAERADRAQAAGRYEEALALLDAALAAPGAREGPILFDLGGASWRLGRHPQALWFWRRAALRLPRDPALAFNVGFAERQLEVDAPPPGPVERLLGKLTRDERFWGGVALAAAAIAGAVLARRRRVLAVSFGLAAALGLAVSAHALGWMAGPPRGVVLAREVGLRPDPHRDSAVGVRLRAGETVRVEQRSNRWARVTHARGSGWTESAGVGVVD